MDFNDEQDVLWFFEGGGCAYDMERSVVYISDVNADGDFFGIMVAKVPANMFGSVAEACEYALGSIPAPGTCAPNRMELMDVESTWFDTLADMMVDEPSRFTCERG